MCLFGSMIVCLPLLFLFTTFRGAQATSGDICQSICPIVCPQKTCKNITCKKGVEHCEMQKRECAKIRICCIPCCNDIPVCVPDPVTKKPPQTEKPPKTKEPPKTTPAPTTPTTLPRKTEKPPQTRPPPVTTKPPCPDPCRDRKCLRDQICIAVMPPNCQPSTSGWFDPKPCPVAICVPKCV